MKVIIIALALLMTACASSPKMSNTMDIISQAAESAPKTVYGEYTLNIKAAGESGETVYLNTELDYRDQRNVSVALHPKLLSKIEEDYGSPAIEFFVGKTLQVKGNARRVKIGFNIEGRPSNLYYYQTHIPLSDLSNLIVLE